MLHGFLLERLELLRIPSDVLRSLDSPRVKDRVCFSQQRAEVSITSVPCHHVKRVDFATTRDISLDPPFKQSIARAPDAVHETAMPPYCFFFLADVAPRYPMGIAHPLGAIPHPADSALVAAREVGFETVLVEVGWISQFSWQLPLLMLFVIFLLVRDSIQKRLDALRIRKAPVVVGVIDRGEDTVLERPPLSGGDIPKEPARFHVSLTIIIIR